VKKSVFSVYDSKAQVFATPFFSHNSNTAIRDFNNAALDENSALYRNPSDFTLFEIGKFCDETGLLEPIQPSINHGFPNNGGL